MTILLKKDIIIANKILFDVANAINVLNTQYEIKELKNDSDETIMHLEAGLFGLSLFNDQ